VRTEFQRDRDRILHCKAFRRLKHKTQVFIAPVGDHFVTRLTHTLEVAQIARTIARGLNLNEDLAGRPLSPTTSAILPFGRRRQALADLLLKVPARRGRACRLVDKRAVEPDVETRDGIATARRCGRTSSQRATGRRLRSKDRS
jgi:dGTPase